MSQIIDEPRRDVGSDNPADTKELARQQAIKQIERRRHFRISTALSSVGMLLLVAIWAMSEYHNAGGWPMHGFSQSSGIHEVWNFWIIYPLLGWAFLTTAAGWSVYLRKPISEREIKREIEREANRGDTPSN